MAWVIALPLLVCSATHADVVDRLGSSTSGSGPEVQVAAIQAAGLRIWRIPTEF